MRKSRDTELLRRVEDRGYPTEYLFSRIRGRRSYLITDWKPLALGASPPDFLPSRYGDIMTDDYPEGIWRYLLKEFGWVYFQMNRALWEIFWPFFLYTEIRTICVCLRYAKGGETGKIERLLSSSLLSKKTKAILGGGGNLSSAVGGIEDRFILQSNGFSGLRKVFDEAGLRGVEQFLSKRYLEHTAYSKLHPVMKDFFVSVIDSRNILSLYKFLILNAKNTPYFIRGGRITEKMFMRAAGRKDFFDLASLIRKFTGLWIEKPDAANMENALYRMVTLSLRKTGGDPLGVGLILDYLWRCSLEARNLSTLFYGREIDREILAAELV